jgi:tRNA dimethylallyltransferase
LSNQNNNKKHLITIAGPTGVGKTAISIKLAQHFNADIFSADSRQLYKEMSIGTAKPTELELSQAKHHFINHVSINEHYNAGIYEREFNEIISTYFTKNDIGILTGGTGMYIRAAIEGLDHFPDIPKVIRERFEKISTEDGLELLQNLVKELDPEYAKVVDINNARRLTRALEVIETSGKTFTSFLNQKKERKPAYNPIKICLTRDRAQLYNQINQRVDQMMAEGQLNEVKRLLPYKNLKSMQTVGYSELFRHLEGELSLHNAVELFKRNSRRYAKRQMTWFRNQGEWKMIEAENYDKILDTIHEYGL